MGSSGSNMDIKSSLKFTEMLALKLRTKLIGIFTKFNKLGEKQNAVISCAEERFSFQPQIFI